jgi:hypothetical protein
MRAERASRAGWRAQSSWIWAYQSRHARSKGSTGPAGEGHCGSDSGSGELHEIRRLSVRDSVVVEFVLVEELDGAVAVA